MKSTPNGYKNGQNGKQMEKIVPYSARVKTGLEEKSRI